MEIKENRDGTKLTLELFGRLETSTAPKLQEIVDKGLSGILHLQIGMANLQYISSAGLRTLLEAKKKMQAADGVMIVAGANEEVMKIFEMTGFHKILDIK